MKGSDLSYSKGARGIVRERGFTGALVTKWLMIAIAALFIVDVMGRGSGPGRLEPYLALNSDAFHEVWRWLLYPLVNLNIGNWFFSLISLYVFGTVAEKAIGSRRYGMILLFTTVIGALIYILVSLTVDAGSIPLNGAGGLSMALIVALGMLYPRQKIQLMIPPVSLKLSHLVIGCAVLMIVMPIIMRTGPAEALANLSSIAVSFLCMKNLHWLDLGSKKNKKTKSRKVKKKAKKRVSEVRGMKARTILNMRESKQESEVNKILDKVSAEGIGNLTEEEKEILKFVSNK